MIGRMIGSCMQRLVALVGCLIILLVSAGLAWQYRGEMLGFYHTHVQSRLAKLRSGGDPAPAAGIPSTTALRAAERKEAAIARRDGPPYVTLMANEMASLIHARLDERARSSLDSLRVSLGDNRLTVEAQVLAERVAGSLGPFGGLLADREPLRATGPVTVQQAGVVAWRPDELSLRNFPLPEVAIPGLINSMTGGSDGAFHIAVPRTVGDVRVRPDGVTFYRWVP